MTTDLAPQDLGAALLERVLITGDLNRLSSAERLQYYRTVCDSVGLNPLTRPFDYLTLSGRLTLYARKDATDQLRKIHGVSIYKIERELVEGLYIVVVYARDKTGREDSDMGAVSIDGLKGEARANAILKAVTKAKRRVTLSICGLGLLDETEVETIPGAVVGEPPTEEPEEPERDRERLLGNIRIQADRQKLTPTQRRELWATHCGDATPDEADVSALVDLLTALRGRA